MRKLIGLALLAAIGGYSQFGGAAEPETPEATLASTALERGKVPGCGRFAVTETDAFLKRIAVICDDGATHWISHDGVLKVDGRAV